MFVTCVNRIYIYISHYWALYWQGNTAKESKIKPWKKDSRGVIFVIHNVVRFQKRFQELKKLEFTLTSQK